MRECEFESRFTLILEIEDRDGTVIRSVGIPINNVPHAVLINSPNGYRIDYPKEK